MLSFLARVVPFILLFCGSAAAAPDGDSQSRGFLGGGTELVLARAHGGACPSPGHGKTAYGRSLDSVTSVSIPNGSRDLLGGKTNTKSWRLAELKDKKGAAQSRPAGLYRQDWFLSSNLDLKADLAAAAGKGRHLVVLWEMEGCPFCKLLHERFFSEPENRDFIKSNFEIVQLDLLGNREVTDFDGKSMTEKRLAGRWRIRATPTLTFFPDRVGEVDGASGGDVEVSRAMGFSPTQLLKQFKFVAGGRYETETFDAFLEQN